MSTWEVAGAETEDKAGQPHQEGSSSRRAGPTERKPLRQSRAWHNQGSKRRIKKGCPTTTGCVFHGSQKTFKERKACNRSTTLRHQGARLCTHDPPQGSEPAELCSRPGPLLHASPNTILNSRMKAGAQAEGMVSF